MARRGIQVPTIEALPGGPKRDLVIALHVLYVKSGPLSLADVSRIAEQDRNEDLGDTIKPDTVSRLLAGRGDVKWSKIKVAVQIWVAAAKDGPNLEAELAKIHDLYLKSCSLNLATTSSLNPSTIARSKSDLHPGHVSGNSESQQAPDAISIGLSNRRHTILLAITGAHDEFFKAAVMESFVKSASSERIADLSQELATNDHGGYVQSLIRVAARHTPLDELVSLPLDLRLVGLVSASESLLRAVAHGDLHRLAVVFEANLRMETSQDTGYIARHAVFRRPEEVWTLIGELSDPFEDGVSEAVESLYLAAASSLPGEKLIRLISYLRRTNDWMGPANILKYVCNYRSSKDTDELVSLLRTVGLRNDADKVERDRDSPPF